MDANSGSIFINKTRIIHNHKPQLKYTTGVRGVARPCEVLGLMGNVVLVSHFVAKTSSK